LTNRLEEKFSQPIKIVSQSKISVQKLEESASSKTPNQSKISVPKFDQSASSKILPTNQNGEPIKNLSAQRKDGVG